MSLDPLFSNPLNDLRVCLFSLVAKEKGDYIAEAESLLSYKCQTRFAEGTDDTKHFNRVGIPMLRYYGIALGESTNV